MHAQLDALVSHVPFAMILFGVGAATLVWVTQVGRVRAVVIREIAFSAVKHPGFAAQVRQRGGFGVLVTAVRSYRPQTASEVTQYLFFIIGYAVGAVLFAISSAVVALVPLEVARFGWLAWDGWAFHAGVAALYFVGAAARWNRCVALIAEGAAEPVTTWGEAIRYVLSFSGLRRGLDGEVHWSEVFADSLASSRAAAAALLPPVGTAWGAGVLSFLAVDEYSFRHHWPAHSNDGLDSDLNLTLSLMFLISGAIVYALTVVRRSPAVKAQIELLWCIGWDLEDSPLERWDPLGGMRVAMADAHRNLLRLALDIEREGRDSSTPVAVVIRGIAHEIGTFLESRDALSGELPARLVDTIKNAVSYLSGPYRPELLAVLSDGVAAFDQHGMPRTDLRGAPRRRVTSYLTSQVPAATNWLTLMRGLGVLTIMIIAAILWWRHELSFAGLTSSVK